jgi:hypothetical protein
VSTTVITVELLQNSIDLQSGKQNEVIRMQLKGVSDGTVEENAEPTTSPLTDSVVGAVLLSDYHDSLVYIIACLRISLSL